MKEKKIPTGTIESRSQEFDCPACCNPVFAGDDFWLGNENQKYCSAECADFGPWQEQYKRQFSRSESFTSS